ncbi:MAG: cytochrome c, partial [Rhodospirillales bacterium]|nr:cytochrome c [Rhodospirillales bacterium]
HGAGGLGDGPDLKELNLPPADLVHMLDMLPMNDDFFLWAVSEGGVPFGSQMPTFKDVLARDDIWRVIAFMRAGFPR